MKSDTIAQNCEIQIRVHDTLLTNILKVKDKIVLQKQQNSKYCREQNKKGSVKNFKLKKY